jgi:hypothetical protein
MESYRYHLMNGLELLFCACDLWVGVVDTDSYLFQSKEYWSLLFSPCCRFFHLARLVDITTPASRARPK